MPSCLIHKIKRAFEWVNWLVCPSLLKSLNKCNNWIRFNCIKCFVVYFEFFYILYYFIVYHIIHFYELNLNNLMTTLVNFNNLMSNFSNVHKPFAIPFFSYSFLNLSTIFSLSASVQFSGFLQSLSCSQNSISIGFFNDRSCLPKMRIAYFYTSVFNHDLLRGSL